MTAPGPDLDHLLEVARLAAREGARCALRWRERVRELRVQEKTGPGDLVSRADEDTERAVRGVLARHRPGDGVLGEEHGTTTGSTGVHWIVDPIDGTTNYLYGRPDWAVSVAAADTAGDGLLAAAVAEPALGLLTEARRGGATRVNGAPVDPPCARPATHALVELNVGRDAQRDVAGRMVDALLPRVRDVRRGGSAAAALAQVAAGRADALWAPGLRAWDCAAGALLAQQAGATVGDLSGPSPGTWPHTGDVLACPRPLWDHLRAMLAPVYGAAPHAAGARPAVGA